jgi:hypothetical protein
MTVERESPEATICGQLLIVRNTLSLLPRVEIVRHLVRKHKEVGEQSGVGRFEGRMEARKERNSISRPRATVNPPQSSIATQFPLPFPISRRRHDLARGREMEFVEIVRHLVRKHKEVGEQSGVGRFEVSRRRHDLVVAEAYTSSPWR